MKFSNPRVFAFLAASARMLLAPGFIQVANASSWNEGAHIQHNNAVAPTDNFGKSIDASSDGNIIAIGCDGCDLTSGGNHGMIEVRTFNGTSWNPRGSGDGRIWGSDNSQQLGQLTRLSPDGNIILGQHNGGAQIYVWNGTDYAVRGSAIPHKGGTDMSYDGSIVAVGVPGQNYARAYEYNSTLGEYTQRGMDITDTDIVNADNFADGRYQTMAMSSDGAIIAIGAPFGTAVPFSRQGFVQVFEYNGTDYVPRGGRLLGEDSYHQFGATVVISASGNLLAAASTENNQALGRYIKVYEWDGSNYVIRNDIRACTVDGGVYTPLYAVYCSSSFAKRMRMTPDGSVLAAGDFGTSGKAWVLGYNGTQWNQIANTVHFPYYHDIAISDDASRFIGTRIGNDQGQGAKVYNFDGDLPELVGVSLTRSSGTSASSSPRWDINFINVTADFTSDSEEELKMIYQVGSGRTFEHILQAGGCEAPYDITGLEYNVTNSTTGSEGGLDFLQLYYSIAKDSIASSNVWNTGTNKIELCQTVKLILEDMVITEVKSNVTVDFDLTASFSLDNETAIDLKGATILANNENTTLNDYISAYKCEDIGVQSIGDQLKLEPNQVLKVCVQSESTDVQIDEIVTMNIAGTNPTTKQSEVLPVIANGLASFSAITSFQKDNNRANPTGIVVTRVPANLFDFEAADAKIDISGVVTVKLAGTQRKLFLGGSNRLLQAGEDTNLFDANENNAAFALAIELESENTDELEGAMMSSGKAIAGKVTAIVGMAVVTTFVLW